MLFKMAAHKPLLRKSVGNKIGLYGTPRLQSCCGMHSTANLLMESVNLRICGIQEPETFEINDVRLTDIVPELPHSLPSAFDFEGH